MPRKKTVVVEELRTSPVGLRIETETKAAGGVLTAKQAPHRPGTAPAPGLRAGRDVLLIVTQATFRLERA